MMEFTRNSEKSAFAKKLVNAKSALCTGEKTIEHGRNMANKSQSTKTKKEKRKLTTFYEFTGRFGRTGALSTIDVRAETLEEALEKLRKKVKYGFKGRDIEGFFHCLVNGYRIVMEIQPHTNIEPIDLGKKKIYKKK